MIFETIWPLFLFLILMWIRTQNLVFHYDACKNIFLISPSMILFFQVIMIWNILDQLGFYQQYKRIFVDGIIHVIIIQIRMMNLIHRMYFYFLFLYLFFFWRLWEQFSSLTNSLSRVLNDNEIIGNLTALFSEIDSINDYINIWNGKLIIK
jgi:hypothetical protein